MPPIPSRALRRLLDLAAWLGCFVLATAGVKLALVVGQMLAIEP